MNISEWRKLYHVVGGLFFPVLYLFCDKEWVIAVCGLFLLGSLGLEWIRFDFPRINNWLTKNFWFLLKHEERFALTGHTYLLTATLAVLIFFEKNIAIMALAFLALGDSSAFIVGKKFGRIKVFNKTFEGTLACLVTCLAIGFGYHLIDPSVGWKLIAVGAVTSSIVELIPLRINDNLTVPICAAFMMSMVV